MGQEHISFENIFGETTQRTIKGGIQSLPQRLSVYGLLPIGGKIAVVKEHGDVWEIPGGKIEKRQNQQETPIEALIRELQEEIHPSLPVLTRGARIIFQREYNFVTPHEFPLYVKSKQTFYLLPTQPVEASLSAIARGRDELEKVIRLATIEELLAEIHMNYSARLALKALQK